MNCILLMGDKKWDRGIAPMKEEDYEQFVERIARSAWNYAQSIKHESAA